MRFARLSPIRRCYRLAASEKKAPRAFPLSFRKQSVAWRLVRSVELLERINLDEKVFFLLKGDAGKGWGRAFGKMADSGERGLF